MLFLNLNCSILICLVVCFILFVNLFMVIFLLFSLKDFSADDRFIVSADRDFKIRVCTLFLCSIGHMWN